MLYLVFFQYPNGMSRRMIAFCGKYPRRLNRYIMNLLIFHNGLSHWASAGISSTDK
jgi:hypothetical protein